MNQDKRQALDTIIREDYANTAGIVALKNGETVFESYYNGYSANDPVHIASVTKSVLSALIGIAAGKGCIKDMDETLLHYFPAYTLRPGEKTLPHITIKNILTMTAPYTFVEEPYEAFFAEQDWVKASLNLMGGNGEIGAFRYAPIVGPDVLSGILTRATGQPVLDFARENLFGPLGISVAESVMFRSKEEHLAFFSGKAASGWVADGQGVNTAAWGLTLTAGDMAKIGQLYLNAGTWQGRQLVPAAWVKESTTAHSHWGDLAYGYLWWVLDEEKRTYAALGDGGNAIYVNEAQQLVVAITSLFQPDAKDRVALIKEHIEPLLIA